ncbi:hypothetical protein BC351_38770 [Paenibacillus ferrarius]|uniref:Uncharacterized protein n=1 Tax=Paenibacillus ferrarius TaxID=1469647 RepID=A0A1V4H9K9_9BACL|nr:hypothetical protein BC351_38770 [Paenibacillus ferrarius]
MTCIKNSICTFLLPKYIRKLSLSIIIFKYIHLNFKMFNLHLINEKELRIDQMISSKLIKGQCKFKALQKQVGSVGSFREIRHDCQLQKNKRLANMVSIY